MDLAYFSVLIYELLNKYSDIVPEEAPLILFCRNSAVCMYKNGKDTNHTRHISKIVYFVIDGEKCKFHKIDWCEGGIQLTDIATNNVGENYLNHRIKYIIVRLEYRF